MKILISTDTSCLTSYEVFDKYNISTFPLNVIIDGEEFLDGVTIKHDQLNQAMRANKEIKTSTPPLGDVIEYFEKLFAEGYDHIIHFTISSKLSSMYSLFCNVAKEHFAGKLTIIDSYVLSSTMLSYVFTAYDLATKGASVEEIVATVEEKKKKNHLVFIPENLFLFSLIVTVSVKILLSYLILFENTTMFPSTVWTDISALAPLYGLFSFIVSSILDSSQKSRLWVLKVLGEFVWSILAAILQVP